MDDDLRQRLYDPAGSHRLVLARRPPHPDAVTCVVSDVVWLQVVRLLRWSAATTDAVDVDAGRWWRLAAGCADLLHRLPGLCDELGEPYGPTGPATTPSCRHDPRRARHRPARRAPLLPRRGGPAPARR